MKLNLTCFNQINVSTYEYIYMQLLNRLKPASNCIIWQCSVHLMSISFLVLEYSLANNNFFEEKMMHR